MARRAFWVANWSTNRSKEEERAGREVEVMLSHFTVVNIELIRLYSLSPPLSAPVSAAEFMGRGRKSNPVQVRYDSVLCYPLYTDRRYSSWRGIRGSRFTTYRPRNDVSQTTFLGLVHTRCSTVTCAKLTVFPHHTKMTTLGLYLTQQS